MNPTVHRVAEPALRSMEWSVRRNVLRRIEDMGRELAFLMDRENENLQFIRANGWSEERIELIFVLNSIYQQVLGPLQAATEPGPESLGREVSIKHGVTSFDRERADSVRMAMRGFNEIVDKLELQRSWLHANTCGDLVLLIARFERDRLEVGD